MRLVPMLFAVLALLPPAAAQTPSEADRVSA